MKRMAGVLLVGLLAPLAAASAQAPKNMNELTLRDGVYVDIRTLEPYSGPVVDMWNDSTIRERGTLVDGRWDGVHETFYFEGQLEQRETYRNGVLHGPFESYFRMGILSDRGTYENGLLEGPYEAYWSRHQGQSMHEMHMMQGQMQHQMPGHDMPGHEMQGQDSMMMMGELAEQGVMHEGRPCGPWYRFLPNSEGTRVDQSTTYPPCPGNAGN
ncbi:MAG TPA: hypothetical protein VFQ22_12500 [Longimicrobiales bacterium]|nr:hypothetical protein [Longimicrobiales bacterium]